MYTTANDCYSGERLIVGRAVARRNIIPLAHAVGASSSLPGVIGPTLLGQRFCMDGGISRTWAHTDVVAGSKRALVITLTNGYEGSLLSGIPHNIDKEIDALQATGTQTMLIIAGTPAGVNLLDPRQIEPALRTDMAAPRSKRTKSRSSGHDDPDDREGDRQRHPFDRYGVRSWHLADITVASANVRFLGKADILKAETNGQFMSTRPGMPLHFAYGSNMSRALMRQHCPAGACARHRGAYSSSLHRDGGRLRIDRPAAGAQRARRAVATDPARP